MMDALAARQMQRGHVMIKNAVLYVNCYGLRLQAEGARVAQLLV